MELVRLVNVSDAPTLPISQTYPHLSRNACTECAPEKLQQKPSQGSHHQLREKIVFSKLDLYRTLNKMRKVNG